MPGASGSLPSAFGDTAAAGAGAARKGQRRVRTGDTLGRYHLGDELGEGGMATVYRARDRELRRDVAVKVLFPHLARRAEIVQRFHREARAAAGLEHPNILRIYDVGGSEDGDPPYIVMELIRGRTLLQEIEQRGAMLAEVTACIGALLGDALAAAHAAGIIHRDVKPANVLIAPGGRLLLADFGVARLETEDSLVTRTGALLGTPAYMSPEQACGDIATARSDLYSLGATLYQLATGTLPYAGAQAKVMSMIASGSMVAPVRRRPACGQELSRQVERLMATDPAARPASAIAVAGELRSLATDSGLGDPSEELAAYFEDPEGFLRVRTPVVVAALVASAHAAIADAKLPRAMALADRASALAPADPAVVQLIHAVTEGGHASRRKRAMAIAGGVLALVGGAVAIALQVAGEPDAAGRSGQVSGGAEIGSAPADGERLAGGGGSAGAGGGSAGAGGQLAPTSGQPAPTNGQPAPTNGQPAPTSRQPAPGSGQPVATGQPAPTSGQPAAGSGEPVSGGGQPAAVSGQPSPAAGVRPRPADRAATGGQPGSATGRAPTGRAPTSAAPSSGARDAAGRPARDAVSPIDAGAAVAQSAGSAAIAPPSEPVALPVAPSIDAGTPPAAVPGRVVVRNDVWCNVWIDGNNHGNRRNEPIEVPAGHHTVRCANPSVGEWTQTTDVIAGGTRELTGSLLRELQVTLDVDATIDGKQYERGAVVRLKPGNIEVIAGGKKQFITFRTSCRLKDIPELGCYL